MRTAFIYFLLVSCSSLIQSCQTNTPERGLAKTVSPAIPPSLPPENAALLDQANQYARDGLFREAVSAFRKYLSTQPKDAAAHRTLGIIYVKSGAYKQAIVQLQEALPAFPGNFELNYYLAEALRTQDRFADAIYHYKRALEADPKNLPTLKALTWSYYSIRFYTEALKSARLLRKMDPNDFQISIIQARIMNKIGMNDKALLILNKAEALASPEEVPYLYSVKGDIYLDQGERNKAEQAYRRALQDQPLLPGALTGLARKMLSDSKGNDQAIAYLERALRIKPNHVEAIYLLGKAYDKSDAKKSEEYLRLFFKEANLDPLFQQEIAALRSRFASDEKKSKDGNDAPHTAKEEELEDQL